MDGTEREKERKRKRGREKENNLKKTYNHPPPLLQNPLRRDNVRASDTV